MYFSVKGEQAHKLLPIVVLDLRCAGKASTQMLSVSSTGSSSSNQEAAKNAEMMSMKVLQKDNG